MLGRLRITIMDKQSKTKGSLLHRVSLQSLRHCSRQLWAALKPYMILSKWYKITITNTGGLIRDLWSPRDRGVLGSTEQLHHLRKSMEYCKKCLLKIRLTNLLGSHVELPWLKFRSESCPLLWIGRTCATVEALALGIRIPVVKNVIKSVISFMTSLDQLYPSRKPKI